MSGRSGGSGVRGTLAGLTSSPLFESLPEAILRSVEPELSSVRLQGGDPLFLEGSDGDSMYVVVFGRLRAMRRAEEGGATVLGEIGRGESVGEMAVLSGEPRSATVYAIRDTELVRFTRDSFERLAERCPAVTLELARLIIARYQRAMRPPVETSPVTIAIVPCVADGRVTVFLQNLVGALRRSGDVLFFDSDSLQREQGVSPEQIESDLGRRELAHWFHEQEQRHDHIVYGADATPSAWTNFCVRQADVVLVVGSRDAASVDPCMHDLLRLNVGRVPPRRELVLLYDSAEGTTETTAEWLSAIPVSAHHHIDPARPTDFERLVRRLTGRAIALVLGGGGARGLSHIGVIRALEEARVPIDLVGGTSIGAIIGAQFASGWPSERIVGESRKVFVDAGSLNDYTLPIIALLHGRRYVRLLVRLFGDRRIENLPLDFFCTSTNLTRGEPVVHRSGPIRKWVAASMAVPGLGPPIFDGRDVLVDGGVMSNLPVATMRRIGRGFVIASSVAGRIEMSLDRDYDDIPSPWRILFSRINPFGTPMRVPGIASILIRTVSLPHMSGPRELDNPDLLLEPPIGDYRLLDWRSLDKLVDIGYRSALPAVEAWQETLAHGNAYWSRSS